MDDEELEQRMRDGLERRAEQADVAVPVVARARSAVRRRRTRVVTVGLVAASVVAVAVVGVAVGIGRDDDTSQVSDEATPTPTASATTAPDPMGETRIEYYGAAQVEIPADWGWGSSPVLCGEAPIGKPYVGRPIATTDACGQPDVDAVPTAPYAWLGADLPVGSFDLGEGWTRETIDVGGTTVSVATQDADLRNQILASAATQDLCEPELRRVPPAAYENTAEGLGAFVDARVCAYRLRADGYELVYAKALDQTLAERTFTAVAAAAPVSGDLDCSDNEVVTVDARYRDNFGAAQVRLTRSNVFVFGGCGVIDRGPFDQNETVHEVTEASVMPWASGEAFRHILTGPYTPWVYSYFIGMQG